MSTYSQIRNLHIEAKRLAVGIAMSPALLLDHDACLADVARLESEVAGLRRAVESRRPVGLERFVEVWNKATPIEQATVCKMLLSHAGQGVRA